MIEEIISTAPESGSEELQKPKVSIESELREQLKKYEELLSEAAKGKTIKRCELCNDFFVAKASQAYCLNCNGTKEHRMLRNKQKQNNEHRCLSIKISVTLSRIQPESVDAFNAQNDYYYYKFVQRRVKKKEKVRKPRVMFDDTIEINTPEQYLMWLRMTLNKLRNKRQY